MELFLIRHGRTRWNQERVFRGRADVPLDEVGRREAEFLAQRLKGEGIRAIYCSPLSRARETAQILSRVLEAPVTVSPELVDLDFGRWQGLSVREVERCFGELYRKWLKSPHEVIFPEGESLREVYNRVVPFVEGLKGRHKGEAVAIVSHRVVLKVLICWLLGLGLNDFWRVEQGTSALSLFQWKDNTWVVKFLNDTCHLNSLKEGGVEF